MGGADRVTPDGTFAASRAGGATHTVGRVPPAQRPLPGGRRSHRAVRTPRPRAAVAERWPAVSASDTPTAWDLRRRLGITAPLREQPGESPDTLIRQICARRAEKHASPTGSPAWRVADLAEQELIAALARGGITPDGIEWLVRRLQPWSATFSAPDPPPTPAPPTTPGTDSIPALPLRSSGRRGPGSPGTVRRRSVRAAGT